MTADTGHERAAEVVHLAITTVAPDTDPSVINKDDDLWYTLDLDSMDQLNVMVAIGERLGVEIPEADYQRLETLDQLVGFVRQAMAG